MIPTKPPFPDYLPEQETAAQQDAVDQPTRLRQLADTLEHHAPDMLMTRNDAALVATALRFYADFIANPKRGLAD